jgi:hypothetical protein
MLLLAGWYEYFHNANIYCCDIDTSIINFDEERINGFFLDQTNKESIDNALSSILKDISFDIIIDDGLHWFPTNCDVMNKLFPKVKKDGYYIIEDIEGSQFNYDNIDMTQLNDKTYQYICLPNSHNSIDNNLFIIKC